jgi:hypothetical protein
MDLLPLVSDRFLGGDGLEADDHCGRSEGVHDSMHVYSFDPACPYVRASFFFDAKPRSIKEKHRYKHPHQTRKIHEKLGRRQPPLPTPHTGGTPPSSSLRGALPRPAAGSPPRQGPHRPYALKKKAPSSSMLSPASFRKI